MPLTDYLLGTEEACKFEVDVVYENCDLADRTLKNLGFSSTEHRRLYCAQYCYVTPGCAFWHMKDPWNGIRCYLSKACADKVADVG